MDPNPHHWYSPTVSAPPVAPPPHVLFMLLYKLLSLFLCDIMEPKLLDQNF
jgi:hypothetical protein